MPCSMQRLGCMVSTWHAGEHRTLAEQPHLPHLLHDVNQPPRSPCAGCGMLAIACLAPPCMLPPLTAPPPRGYVLYLTYRTVLEGGDTADVWKVRQEGISSPTASSAACASSNSMDAAQLWWHAMG